MGYSILNAKHLLRPTTSSLIIILNFDVIAIQDLSFDSLDIIQLS
jgi:hypothetical protein